jgi:ribonuclease HI
MIEIYTDGAVSGNPGPGGAAFIVVRDDENIFEKAFSFSHTTNNFCELFSVSEAIRYLINTNTPQGTIFSDSKYVVDGINKWLPGWENNDWRSSSGNRIKNMELWQNISIYWKVITSICDISIHYVKGHSGNKWNNIADKLARGAVIQKYENN